MDRQSYVPHVRFKVYTGTKEMAVPFAGPKLFKEAPGGLTDVMCRQAVATLSSYRPICEGGFPTERAAAAK